MIAIRPLIISNISSFVDVHLKCWEETYYGIFPKEVMESRIKHQKDREEHIKNRLICNDNYFYYTLCDDDKIIGILIFSILDDGVILDALYIKKDYQRMGYGTQLLQFMEMILKQKKIVRYYVYVLRIIKSHDFFLSHGVTFLKSDYISIHGKDYEELEYEKVLG